jgi:hypothetical protein
MSRATPASTAAPPCTSATIASTASTPCRAPSSCPVAWLTAPTAFELKGGKVANAEPILNRVAKASFHNTSKLDFKKLKGEPDKIAANLTARLPFDAERRIG